MSEIHNIKNPRNQKSTFDLSWTYVSNCVLYGNHTLIMNIELGMSQVKTQLDSSMNCLTHSRQEIMEMPQVGKELYIFIN